MTTSYGERPGMSEQRGDHTPGPWKVGAKHPTRVMSLDNHSWVADCAREADEDRPTDLELANARLIAQAPALLAACESVLGHYRLAMIALGRSGDAFEASAEVAEARAAIAAAKGGRS